jgi:hypothetical protein
MSNVDTIKNAKPFAELNEEEFEKVTGGGAKNMTGKNDTGDVQSLA